MNYLVIIILFVGQQVVEFQVKCFTLLYYRELVFSRSLEDYGSDICRGRDFFLDLSDDRK